MTVDPASNSAHSRTSGAPASFHHTCVDLQALPQLGPASDRSEVPPARHQIAPGRLALEQAFFGSSCPPDTSPLGDLQSLATALQSNDLTGAQAAMTSLQQVLLMQSEPPGHQPAHPRGFDFPLTSTVSLPIAASGSISSAPR